MTTNNHPAHGPVSLERLHQIREILSKAAAQSDGGNLGYAMADAVKVIDVAIAAFDVEPVSQCDSRKQFEEHFGDGTTPGMERVPPFFVEMMKDAFWTVWEDSRAAMLQAGNSPSKCSLRDGIEAIRNSGIPVDVDKIQSECEAGNSPVTPDGWIPVSERMPEKLIPVMVMYEDGEMWSAMWNGNRWDDGTEYPDPHSVTHWQEMPAAPQREVKNV